MHMWRTFMCPMSIENCSVVNVKWRLNRIIHRNGVGSDSSIDYTIVKYAVCTLYSDRQCSNFSLLLHLFIITKQILFIIIQWPTATTTKPSRKKHWTLWTKDMKNQKFFPMFTCNGSPFQHTILLHETENMTTIPEPKHTNNN